MSLQAPLWLFLLSNSLYCWSELAVSVLFRRKLVWFGYTRVHREITRAENKSLLETGKTAHVNLESSRRGSILKGVVDVVGVNVGSEVKLNCGPHPVVL